MAVVVEAAAAVIKTFNRTRMTLIERINADKTEKNPYKIYRLHPFYHLA